MANFAYKRALKTFISLSKLVYPPLPPPRISPIVSLLFPFSFIVIYFHAVILALRWFVRAKLEATKMSNNRSLVGSDSKSNNSGLLK